MKDDLTLQEGLEIFQKQNHQYFTKRPMTKDGEEFLQCHDIAHVVFGCDTTIYGEGVVKIWTTFGTNLGFWNTIRGYNEVNAFELFKKYSVRHVIKNIRSCIMAVPKTIIRARKMTKPWPFSDFNSYLDTPLSDIRKEFNIQVVS